MADPIFQVESELYIHAARGAVWQAFTRLDEWPRWNSEIVATRWVEGEPWQEGSIFELRHRSLFNRVTSTEAILRMVSPTRTATWEKRGRRHSGGQRRDAARRCRRLLADRAPRLSRHGSARSAPARRSPTGQAGQRHPRAQGLRGGSTAGSLMHFCHAAGKI